MNAKDIVEKWRNEEQPYLEDSSEYAGWLSLAKYIIDESPSSDSTWISVEDQQKEIARLRRFVESLAEWTDEQCSWNDAGVRARGSAQNLLNNL